MKKIFLLLVLLFSIKVTTAQELKSINYGISEFSSNIEFINSKKIGIVKILPNIISTSNQDTQSLSIADTVTIEPIERPNNYVRSNYIFMTIGAIEPIALGFGFQINKDLALGIKFCGYFLSGGTYALNSGLGVGLRISKHIQFGFINIINSEITMLNRTSDSRSSGLFIRGAVFDINIGNENILSNGLHFIWSAGVVGSFAYRITPLFSPNLKIGFNINF
jgi:hypothetical protein